MCFGFGLVVLVFVFCFLILVLYGYCTFFVFLRSYFRASGMLLPCPRDVTSVPQGCYFRASGMLLP